MSTNSIADYVVVGTGSSGAVVAARLSERSSDSVIALEAGPEDKNQAVHIPAAFSKLFQTDLDWNYLTTPQPELGGRQIFWPRGKMLGGSSSMNAMMWVRGFAADYDEWARAAGRAGRSPTSSGISSASNRSKVRRNPTRAAMGRCTSRTSAARAAGPPTSSPRPSTPVSKPSGPTCRNRKASPGPWCASSAVPAGAPPTPT